MSTFAERLKRALDAKGISGYALARAAGVTPSYVSRLLREERAPNLSYQTARGMSVVLAVSTDWLMTGEGAGPVESTILMSDSRSMAVRLAREGGVDEGILEEVAASSPAGSDEWPAYAWIGFIQYLATTRHSSSTRERPPPSTKRAESEVRPRADIRSTTRSASHKKR